jgi:UDP-N-acetylglucosamine 4,6-dehydratase/5-epimerase
MKLNKKVILITGGTGSFGNRVAQYLASQNPKQIIIYSRDEKKQYEMQKKFPDYHYIIGNVRDKERLRFALRKVDYVFQAAALKQVPSCEIYPYEAVKTNVYGSQNLCEIAIESGVETVVALSTDKAVKPINAMGISKAMMEKIICSQNQQPNIPTKFCCVRYGNVMGSRGSVIPLFKKLVADNKKLTITDPGMTRFMMTLGQSVELVLHALTNCNGGEVFVKKAPAATVLDLAKTMLQKYGDGDLERVENIGIRPGEKIDEVLVNEYEITRSIESDDYFTILPEYVENHTNTNYELGYEYTSANTTQLTTYKSISNLLDQMGEISEFI